MIAAGLLLSVASAVAINGGYSLQHASASRLPPLRLRRPLYALHALFGNRRWLIGFLGGVGGWVLYVIALRLAPLSLVQAASAGGIGVLALGGARLRAAERVGVGAALAGLLLLGVSLGSHPPSNRGTVGAVVLWLVASVGGAGLAVRVLPAGAGFGTAAGILYAAGDVATKAAVGGGRGSGSFQRSSPVTGSPSSACSLRSSEAAAWQRRASRCSGRTPCRSSRARSSSANRSPAASTGRPAWRPSRSS